MAMTAKEKQLRQLVVDTAEAWVGTKQGDTNHHKIIDTYNNIYINDIVGKCNKNEWMGNVSPQIFLEDYEIKGSCAYAF